MYKPKIGDRVKMRLWEDYCSRGLGPWGWFEVLELLPDGVRVKTLLEAAGVPTTDHVLPYSTIDPPLHWAEVYDLVAPDRETAEKMRSWLTERGGIAVWGSHDLGTAGRQMYSPGDRTDKPHWSMAMVEVVTDPARCNIQYLETMQGSLPRKVKARRLLEDSGWKWCKHHREWYRNVKL